MIMNLEGSDREVARRLIDFASGLCYGLDGSMEKVEIVEDKRSKTPSPTKTAIVHERCKDLGVLIGKGCHPLTAALYLKRVEGRARDGNPIRPK